MPFLHQLLADARAVLSPAEETQSAHVSRLIFGLLLYLGLARFVMRRLRGQGREFALALLNLAAVLKFFFHSEQGGVWMFALYVAFVSLQYAALSRFADRPGKWPWLAFFTPLAVLVFVRYMPAPFFLRLGGEKGFAWLQGGLFLVGISYLAFRCSRLVLEIRNRAAPKPGYFEYLNFAFFLPTMPVGPINSYANYRRGFAAPLEAPVGPAILRILVGFVKYQLFGGLCGQLGYATLLQDDFLHHWIDLPVAMLFYYLFLYCNFSGFCDIAIGAAALIGIPVPENFDNPFLARNVKDFWNRWHITLSAWMRDVVFSPLSKFFVGRLGVHRADHGIALTIVVVFLLVGIWHGVGWNFAAYGAVHALGVVANHYYTIFLKKKLGRERFKAYNENPWIRCAAVGLTFCYCGASLLFFANTFPQIRGIFASLR